MPPKTIYVTMDVLVWLTKQDKADDTKLNGPKETVCIYQSSWEIEGWCFVFFLSIYDLELPVCLELRKALIFFKKSIFARVIFSRNHFFYNTYTAWIFESLYLSSIYITSGVNLALDRGVRVLPNSQGFSGFHILSFIRLRIFLFEWLIWDGVSQLPVKDTI